MDTIVVEVKHTEYEPPTGRKERTERARKYMDVLMRKKSYESSWLFKFFYDAYYVSG